MSRRFLLDAGPAQDILLLRDPVFSRARREQLSGAKIGICYPTLGEVRGGMEYSQTRDVNLKRLARTIGKLVLWPFDEKAAAKLVADRNYQALDQMVLEHLLGK